MFKHRAVLVHTIFALFLGQIMFWLIFLNYSKLPPVIPLWFLQPWGELRLEVQDAIWIFPGLSVGILAINLVLSMFLYRKQPFLVHIVMATSSFNSVYLLICTLHVLNLVLGWL